MDRRNFLASTAALAVGGSIVGAQSAPAGMHGLIGKITATEGQRDALVAVLLEGTREMPGCLSYVVALDTVDPNAIWVTEVWESGEAHANSLRIPAVRAAIARGMPLIARFDGHATTTPMGGVGLGAAR